MTIPFLGAWFIVLPVVLKLNALVTYYCIRVMAQAIKKRKRKPTKTNKNPAYGDFDDCENNIFKKKLVEFD